MARFDPDFLELLRAEERHATLLAPPAARSAATEGRVTGHWGGHGRGGCVHPSERAKTPDGETAQHNAEAKESDHIKGLPVRAEQRQREGQTSQREYQCVGQRGENGRVMFHQI